MPSVPRNPYSWDGQPSWEWDNPRTLYFEPIAGLGNRLRALGEALSTEGLRACTYPWSVYCNPSSHLELEYRWLWVVAESYFAMDAASAVVMAKEYGVGLKVIWREEEGCGDMCGNPGFNSTWLDLFSEPRLRLADNFPGKPALPVTTSPKAPILSLDHRS